MHFGCPCDLLKCGKLDGIICASGGTAFTVSPEEKQKKGETIVEQREPGRDVVDWGLGVEVGILEDGCGGSKGTK